MGITVKEVTTKKDLKKWVYFPTTLYRDNEYYVPFLMNDEIETFTKEKNAAYEFCETRLFLAYKDGKIVGRIAGLINHAYNKKWNKNAMRFTRFDFIDDYEVSEALFNTVVDWAKSLSYTEIMGPIGFHDIDHEGMLVEGFEELNMSITFYNHPYYLTHMERLGLQKDIDWIEYRISVPEQIDPRLEKIAERLLQKDGYEIVYYTDRKVLYKEAFEAFTVIDEAFSVLYGTVPLTPAVIKKSIDDYIPLVNLDYICSIKNKEGRIVCFGVLVPSMAKALKKSDGKMLPFGIFRLLRALNGKNDTLEMFFVAVDPTYQSKGLPAVLISALARRIIPNGVRFCETGPMLETNHRVHSLWRTFEKRQHRRRRCYIKQI
jgi:GNAT superfamily N-acetyltransferase